LYQSYQTDNLAKNLAAVHTDVAAMHLKIDATRVELKNDFKSEMQALKSDMKACSRRIDALFMKRAKQPANAPKDGGSAPAAPVLASGPAQPTTEAPKKPAS
jgi:hypothetical protein